MANQERKGLAGSSLPDQSKAKIRSVKLKLISSLNENNFDLANEIISSTSADIALMAIDNLLETETKLLEKSEVKVFLEDRFLSLEDQTPNEENKSEEENDVSNEDDQQSQDAKEADKSETTVDADAITVTRDQISSPALKAELVLVAKPERVEASKTVEEDKVDPLSSRRFIQFLDFNGLNKHLNQVLKELIKEGDPDKLAKLLKEIRFLLGDVSKEQTRLGQFRSQVGEAVNEARVNKSRKRKSE